VNTSQFALCSTVSAVAVPSGSSQAANAVLTGAIGWAVAMAWLTVKTKAMATTNTLTRHKSAFSSPIHEWMIGWLLLASWGESIKLKAVFSVCWNLFEILIELNEGSTFHATDFFALARQTGWLLMQVIVSDWLTILSLKTQGHYPGQGRVLVLLQPAVQIARRVFREKSSQRSQRGALTGMVKEGRGVDKAVTAEMSSTWAAESLPFPTSKIHCLRQCARPIGSHHQPT